MSRKRSEEPAVLVTIRIEKELKDRYTELASRMGYSRNKVINFALTYALEHVVVQPAPDNKRYPQN